MTDQLPSQLLAAISLASNPHQASSQSELSSALQFIEQCRSNSNQTWHAGWTVYASLIDSNGQELQNGAAGPGPSQRHNFHARMFGLNLVSDFLENRLTQSPDAASAVAFLQEASLAYIQQEFVEGNGEEGVTFILNKFAQTLTLLLLASYSLPTPSTFLSSLLQLFRAHSSSSPASTTQVPLPQVSRSDSFNSSRTTAPRLNSLTTSLLLRHLHDLSLTLGSDASLRSVRSRERLTRDAAIRDEIRSKDASELMRNLWEVSAESVSIVDGNQESLKDGDQRTMLRNEMAVTTAEMAMRTLGAYSSWLDISLTLTPTTLPLMQHFLHHPTQLSLRYAALEPFTELINKGMKPHDKLEVLRILEVTPTIDALQNATHKDNRVAALSAASNAASSSGNGANSFNGTSFDLNSPLSYLFLTTMNDDQLIDFREKLAKLTNIHLSEVVKILEDTSNGSAPTEEATIRLSEEESLKALETSVRWMSDEQDECAEAVSSGIGAWLALQKKVKRRSQSSQVAPQLAPQLTGILQKLLEVILSKMRYDESAVWGGAGGSADENDESEDSDDEERKFMDLRRMLHTLISSVASLNEGLFADVVQSLIVATLDSYDSAVASSSTLNSNSNGPPASNPSMPSWQTAEMGLYAFYFFGEVISNTLVGAKNGITSKSFVQVPPEPKGVNGSKSKYPVTSYPSLPLSNLGNLMSRLMQSQISSFPHPAIQLQYMEILVRYSSYFDKVRPSDIQSQQALPAFLDWRGVHHRKLGVRNRAQYLINRFVKDTRSVIPTEAVGGVMECMQDLLVVRAELPSVEEGEDPLHKATSTASSFDSQLYLFDTSGSLISLLTGRDEDERQVGYLKAVVEPLSNQLQEAVQSYISSPGDLQLVLQVHHLMLALSSLAKGFPEVPNASVAAPSSSSSSSSATTTNGNQANGTLSANARPAWVQVFASVTETILVALRALNQFEVVREAARGAISRIISSAGEALLPYIPPLIDALLTEAKALELVDFLSFLTMIVRKYKEHVHSSMDELFLTLLERVFYFLNQDISGTDDAVQRNELQKAYVGLLSALVGTGLDGVMISKKNQPQLQTVLQSLVYYSTNSDVSCQRVSLSVLSRLVTLWGRKNDIPNGNSTTTSNGTSTPSNSTPLPGFEQFIYETLVPLTFEAPAKDAFDFNDAQSQMVLGEISTLLKSIQEARGDELLNYLATVYLPGIQCPSDLMQELIHCIQNQDSKTLKKAIQAFVQRLRGQSS